MQQLLFSMACTKNCEEILSSHSFLTFPLYNDAEQHP